MPVQKLKIVCSFRILLNFLEMVSHVPLFLLLLIGKLSLHIYKRNLVSVSDQLGHRFRLTDPSVRLFSLLSLALVEDAGEDDVLRRDVAGINCTAFVPKSGYIHTYRIPPP